MDGGSAAALRNTANKATLALETAVIKQASASTKYVEVFEKWKIFMIEETSARMKMYEARKNPDPAALTKANEYMNKVKIVVRSYEDKLQTAREELEAAHTEFKEAEQRKIDAENAAKLAENAAKLAENPPKPQGRTFLQFLKGKKGGTRRTHLRKSRAKRKHNTLAKKSGQTYKKRRHSK